MTKLPNWIPLAKMCFVEFPNGLVFIHLDVSAKKDTVFDPQQKDIFLPCLF